MRILLFLPFTLLFLASMFGCSGCPQKAKDSKVGIDIAFEEFTLDNGLRVIVHTDRKAPIVAVNVWYHVGSKDEPKGQTGFAHLFEHLMFNGTENQPGDYFGPLSKIGATNLNGTTNTDRTNYFQNVPTTALETALFLESDRMGHLLGAITQETLDVQIGVVQNEKRQGENRPYGRSFERILKAIYPEDHPYHHTTIGSLNDLKAASLGDVKDWFKKWYGPNNAVLVLAGDIDIETAKKQVTRYFGDIPASVTIKPLTANIPIRTNDTRDTMNDRVSQTRIMQVWSIPEFASIELQDLQLFASVLGGISASRLEKRLVHKDKLVDRTSAFVSGSELAGIFVISTDVKQDIEAATVEKAIQEEIQTLLKDGPTAEELQQAKMRAYSGFVRGVEQIGGFGGKADVLAQCAVFTGDSGCFRGQFARMQNATSKQIVTTAQKWLGKGKHTLTIVPGEPEPVVEPPTVRDNTKITTLQVDPKYKTVATDVDRSKGTPYPEDYPELKFPKIQRAELNNGIKIILAERNEIPVVALQVTFPFGHASDLGKRTGTASMAMQMLTESAGKFNALELASRKDSLGATLASSSSLDFSAVSVSSLSEKLDDTIALLADVVIRPTFLKEEMERVRSQWIATIKQEKTSPNGMSSRVIRPLIFGKDHPYGIPNSGNGYEMDIQAMSRDELVNWHKENIRPDVAVVTIVGNTTLAEAKTLLEKHFGTWKTDAQTKNAPKISPVSTINSPRVYLLSQPGAIQANISAAIPIPPSSDKSSDEFDLSNEVIGGNFLSRLNMNLREDKHWSYGASSGAGNSLGQRLWSARAPVQIDKTVDAIKEMQREISEFVSAAAPVSEEETERIRAKKIRELPGSLETSATVLREIVNMHVFGKPDDYMQQYMNKVKNLTPQTLRQAAKTINPNALTWIIVGDLTKIEAGIRELNLGPVKVIDADANEVLPSAE